MRYWTLSNLPLFMLAMPMLYILLHSGAWAWKTSTVEKDHCAQDSPIVGQAENIQSASIHHNSPMQKDMAIRIALPQVTLAVVALTTYHVQIISRLSSGYPIWYWWLASLIVGDQTNDTPGRKLNAAKLITTWMIMYAIIQGGLFASFLPPA